MTQGLSMKRKFRAGLELKKKKKRLKHQDPLRGWPGATQVALSTLWGGGAASGTLLRAHPQLHSWLKDSTPVVQVLKPLVDLRQWPLIL